MIGAGVAIAAAAGAGLAPRACPRVAGDCPELPRTHRLYQARHPQSGYSRVPGYGLRGPSAAAISGGRLWVANVLGNSVTELSASSGAHLRTLGSSAYEFHGPNAIAVAGDHVWVANVPGNSVTEVSAKNGRRERTLSYGYGFSSPLRPGIVRVAVVGGECGRQLGHGDRRGDWAADCGHLRAPLRPQQPLRAGGRRRAAVGGERGRPLGDRDQRPHRRVDRDAQGGLRAGRPGRPRRCRARACGWPARRAMRSRRSARRPAG